LSYGQEFRLKRNRSENMMIGLIPVCSDSYRIALRLKHNFELCKHKHNNQTCKILSAIQ
jgi:hypothetical protein